VGEETIQYHYRFKFEDGDTRDYDVRFDATSCKLENAAPNTLPEWTRLDFQQCPNCPLSGAQSHCPAAVNIATVVDNCAEIISHKSVQVQVVAPNRTINGKTTVQRALSSLFGLLIGTSDCPRTQFFRPMAYFHLPMASQEETVFRAISTYFLAKYFKGDKTEVFDLDALRDIYANMQVVNEYLVKRLQTCATGDATKNAVVLLHLLSCVLPLSLEESLDDLRPLFHGLLNGIQEDDTKTDELSRKSNP
jgi:hypothetical protein